MQSIQHPISRLRDFTRFGGKASYRLVNRGFGWVVLTCIRKAKHNREVRRKLWFQRYHIDTRQQDISSLNTIGATILFIYLSIMLLTDTSPRLDGRPWNSLVMRETVYSIISCVVPNISWKFHENPFIRFSIIVLTIADSQNRKIDPEFKGLITTTRKCFRLFFVSCKIFPENFMKIRSSVFP